MDDILRALELMVIASPVLVWTANAAMDAFFFGQSVLLIFSLMGVLSIVGSLIVSSILSDWVEARAEEGYGLFLLFEDHRILASLLGQALVGVSVWCVTGLLV